MQKLGKVIYNKLVLQAEEAEDVGLKKLSNGILNCIAEQNQDDSQEYSSNKLNNDLYNDLWKAASNIIKYYNVNSLDAQKLGDTIEFVTQAFLSEVEKTLEIDSSTIGSLEPKLPGEDK